jgi:predicted transcriptional regulator
MRTIIRLDDDLHRRAKAYAARHRLTLAALIEEALRTRLAPSRAERKASVRLPTFRGQGLRDGVSLDHTSDLLDRMEGRS